jgi:nucleoside-diphosphate-sugar epimerase
VDCVFHIAALVGPYHPQELYFKVNYEGTLNVIDACKTLGIRKIVMSSSPSTRFDGNDINGLREDQLSIRPKGQFLQVHRMTPESSGACRRR